jgi:hypothetical protein
MPTHPEKPTDGDEKTVVETVETVEKEKKDKKEKDV